MDRAAVAHQVRDVHGRAYNRTKHLPQRKEMMQAWADYLDKLANKWISADRMKLYRNNSCLVSDIHQNEVRPGCTSNIQSG